MRRATVLSAIWRTRSSPPNSFLARPRHGPKDEQPHRDRIVEFEIGILQAPDAQPPSLLPPTSSGQRHASLLSEPRQAGYTTRDCPHARWQIQLDEERLSATP